MTLMARRGAEHASSGEHNESIPTPRWWPGGLPHHISDADPEAGSVVVTFEAPGRPQLARWPIDTQPLESWRLHEGHRYAHEYSWTDVRWHWALRCDIELGDDDLERIADSMITSPGQG